MTEYKITMGDFLFPEQFVLGGQELAADDIDIDHMEQAINLTAERLPFLKTEMVRHEGCLLLRENGKPFAVHRGAVPPMPCTEEANGHPVSFSCEGNKLHFCYDHRACDGHGFAMISRLVQYHYCRLHYGKTLPYEGLIQPDEAYSGKEYADPFEGIGDAQPLDDMPAVTAFVPPEKDILQVPGGDVMHLHIPLTELVGATKKLNATPSALAALLMCRVLDGLYPEKTAPISACTVMDIRQILGCPATVQDVLLPVYFTLTDEIKALPAAEQPAAFREALERQRDPEYVRRTVAALRQAHRQRIQMIQNGETAPSGGEACSLQLTYTRRMDRGETGKYFPKLTMNSVENNISCLAIIQQNDFFGLDFINMPKRDAVLAGFRQQLEALGIPYTVIE